MTGQYDVSLPNTNMFQYGFFLYTIFGSSKTGSFCIVILRKGQTFAAVIKQSQYQLVLG